MTTEQSEASHATATDEDSSSDVNRAAARNRKRDKQLRYQRHKAHLATPRNAAASPSETTESKSSSSSSSPIQAQEVSSDESSVQSLSTPPRKNGLSSPYIQNILSTTPPNNKKNVPKEETPERPSCPKRHQAGSRKTDLISKMRVKKRAATSLKPDDATKEEELHIFEQVETPVEHEEESEERVIGKKEEHEEALESTPDDEKASEPGTASTVESETMVDEAYPYQEDTTEDQASASPDTNRQTDQSNEYGERAMDEASSDSDPSLMDIQSEVSETQSAFDMRSILEHPPTPPPGPELVPNDDNTEGVEASSDIAVSNPMDDEFARRLARVLEGSQEEEKKEIEDETSVSQPLDTAWDVSNPVFEQRFANSEMDEAVRDKTGNALDMFDSSSWEEADATFSDVEAQFLQLMDPTQSRNIAAGASFEEKQVLDDVKRNLELASSIDRADSDLSEEGKHSMRYSSPATRLETLTEEESSPNLDEVSLVGIVTNSEDDVGSQNGTDSSDKSTKSKTVEIVKEDEPLLLGAASSSDEGEETGSDNKLSVVDRVDRYNAPNEFDEESSVEEKDGLSSTEEGSDDGDDELEYIGQASDDEDATVDILNPLSLETVQKLHAEAPSFDAAAVAARNSNEDVKVEAEGLPEANAGPAAREPVASSMHVAPVEVDSRAEKSPPIDRDQDPQQFAMMPPPPPPPRTKKNKSKRRKDKTRSAGSLPLLAPPPEEKLKKWEEEKMRGHAHLAAVKSKVEAAKTESLSIDGPPLVSRNLEPSLFSTNPAKPAKSPSDKARSPSNMESVLVDQKMAERVAMASSAAAMSFEERLITDKSGPSPDYQQEKNSESNVTAGGGAFKDWAPSFSTFSFRQEAEQPHLPQSSSPKDVESLKDGDVQSDVKEDVKVDITVDAKVGAKADVKADVKVDDETLLTWLSREVLGNSEVETKEQSFIPLVIRLLLEDDDNFNKMCQHLADSVNAATASLGEDASFDELTLTNTLTDDDTTVVTTKSKQQLQKQRPQLKPVVLSKDSQKLASGLLAANFVSFLYLASKLSRVPSPFGNSNPFLAQIVMNSSLQTVGTLSKSEDGGTARSSPQQVIFDHSLGRAELIVGFVYQVCMTSMKQIKDAEDDTVELNIYTVRDEQVKRDSQPSTPCAANTRRVKGLRFIIPSGHPSPFETAVWEAPRIIPAILSFLGDPVAVCRIKMVNRYCSRLVSENEHTIMQDAVRVGGLDMNIRPAFWMWITLQKCDQDTSSQARRVRNFEELKELEKSGLEGKWSHVIERDVQRSFGNMPPHKTGARLRTDSIVRALVTWGKNRIMRRGVKGGGEETPFPELGPSKRPKDKPSRSSISPPPWECSPSMFADDDESSGTPTDTVSDWGPISPVASMTENSNIGFSDGEHDASGGHNVVPNEELALGGNRLTAEMKSDLQNKLSFILNSLAAAHGDVGYCQGMDYVVAHLLRILQDTIRWNAVQGTLPACVVSISALPDMSGMKDESLAKIYEEVDKALVVQEVIFRVMDAFFTSYNLRHMYWPELRCLKTCCRVFERLIQIKLPVLADHFEHHDLNVGLFALGWFQTLFLYLPSMPSATVCHMWDIWLVERSFKIFFRVGTAILFLSQPILLNHELEGMMTYLNTIPDATLLKPDILIPCALNIKVTNRMLQELESEVTSSTE